MLLDDCQSGAKAVANPEHRYPARRLAPSATMVIGVLDMSLSTNLRKTPISRKITIRLIDAIGAIAKKTSESGASAAERDQMLKYTKLQKPNDTDNNQGPNQSGLT